jgi:hypothetical protein
LSPAALKASAIKSPNSLSLLAEMRETWFNFLSSTFVDLLFHSFTAYSEKAAIPFLTSLKE